jgi:hypothetical protein
MKREDWLTLLFFTGYYLLISIWLWPSPVALIGWWVGGILSLGFEYVDRLIYIYVNQPEAPLSLALKRLLATKHYQAALRLLSHRRHEQTRLMGKSVVFMAVFVPLMYYILSSTTSYLALGLLMGIGLLIILDIGYGWRSFDGLKERLFWPVKRQIADVEAWGAIGVYALFFLWFSYLMIR